MRNRVISMRGRRGIVPDGAIYIGGYVPAWMTHGAALPASKWANPYKIGRDGTRAEVIAKYHDWLLQQPDLLAVLPELVGFDLACWYAPEACHGGVLLELLSGL